MHVTRILGKTRRKEGVCSPEFFFVFLVSFFGIWIARKVVNDKSACK